MSNPESDSSQNQTRPRIRFNPKSDSTQNQTRPIIRFNPKFDSTQNQTRPRIRFKPESDSIQNQIYTQKLWCTSRVTPRVRLTTRVRLTLRVTDSSSESQTHLQSHRLTLRCSDTHSESPSPLILAPNAFRQNACLAMGKGCVSQNVCPLCSPSYTYWYTPYAYGQIHINSVRDINGRIPFPQFSPATP